ncbi:OB-fold domain-containing protein [Mycobacterium sp. 21AC1]|uniref:Zn-ribbon domain-containing OB-fold protein n=1 Tax=[Mycobacterium] appelbergii TaxID=2939269 RepID=UPI002938FC73|nr:OB-fold domain-containing protein [Mycobacterium sp. 21AC1]MDV3125784.1 OB-fold domain-containing protein [Mycobacterium sp. 21AC1]
MRTHIVASTNDALEQQFWGALRQERLELQRCEKCAYVRFPASERCPECWEPGGAWRAVDPVGTVWSHTTYHRSLHPALADAVPYTVALVQLDAGPVLPGRICAGDTTAIGDRVDGVFTVVTPEFTMLEWAPRR